MNIIVHVQLGVVQKMKIEKTDGTHLTVIIIILQLEFCTPLDFTSLSDRS